MKNSGFVFIETIIVICVLTVALITLYNNYSKIIANTKELNTFDTTEYNYKTYYLMKKYNVDDLTDGECTEKNSNFSDTEIVKICKFGNILEEMNLIGPSNKTLLSDAIMRDNVVSTPKTTPGREASLETEAVLATTEDDYGTSYYFRGNVTNNYVNYSGMCWRIVRVQGDGNIKLTLADENGECNASTYSTSNTKSAFIEKRINFVYRSSASFSENDFSFENSDIPEILSSWKASKNLDTTKLVDIEWCNDTAKISEDGASSYYGAYDRLNNVSTANPTLKCDTIGMDGTKAQKYKNILGILSADELVFAGSVKGNANTNNHYLVTNASGWFYWTISPSDFYFLDDTPRMWGALGNGFISTLTLQNASNSDMDYAAVRPAVVLNSNVTVESGDGTQTNPYQIGELLNVDDSEVTDDSGELSPVEMYISNHKEQMDAYIIDYLLKQDLNNDNDNLYLVEYKKEDKQNDDKYFTYISSLTY